MNTGMDIEIAFMPVGSIFSPHILYPNLYLFGGYFSDGVCSFFGNALLHIPTTELSQYDHSQQGYGCPLSRGERHLFIHSFHPDISGGMGIELTSLRSQPSFSKIIHASKKQMEIAAKQFPSNITAVLLATELLHWSCKGFNALLKGTWTVVVEGGENVCHVPRPDFLKGLELATFLSQGCFSSLFRLPPPLRPASYYECGYGYGCDSYFHMEQI